MTIIFQILAIVAVVLVAIVMLRGGGARNQAIQRIFMLLFIVAAGSSIFVPQVWTFAAQLLGVGRGTDLLLYITVLAFLGVSATTYRRFRRLENDLTAMARQVALARVEGSAGQSPTEEPPAPNVDR
ncbi:DUF2304 domain-containing protein [Salinibacterium sp. NK8237]|uniref:DUF2304 domain-containing protein n=1 Tax=Salinibacterium sp. NK8237 TaxID=2792038 RepID=UPI0018CEC23B|nr:DUF2304 domain-containing protein [Salinibacterium sp. NK8237]MBH0129634.1 DUF2304 domain-containing protein [Salinibacterium sp. NK8237]